MASVHASARRRQRWTARTHAGATAAQGNAQDVAALDIKYQAAVKVNDDVVMGALLAHDFALVTGDGGVQTKSDLLNEARSKQYVYAHQEDTHRTVRVWATPRW